MLPRAPASDSKWKLCFSLCSIRTSLLDPEEFIEVLMRGIWMLLSGLLERLTFFTNVKKDRSCREQIQALQKARKFHFVSLNVFALEYLT